MISSAPGKQGHLSPEQAEAVRKNDKLASAAILIDADGKVGKSYNAKVTPHMYVIDPSGKLIYNGAIDDKPTTNKADLAIARNHVKMALEESMAGKEVTVSTSQPYGCGMKY